MARIILLCCLFLSLSWANNKLAQAQDNGLTKKAQIQIYYHNQITYPDPDVVTVVSPNSNGNITVGKQVVLDGPIYDGPEPNSTMVGRTLGTFTAASQSSLGLVIVLNHVFTNGPYKGSTLTMVGLGFPSFQVRELPIVGGSGMFRLARGYELSRSFQYQVDENTTAPRVEFQLNVY